MLKPSYAELMDVMNKDSESDVTSRYTVVIAAAKRARQLIDGDEPMISGAMEGKPVSTAVEEINEGKIKVVPEGEGTVITPKFNVAESMREELEAKQINMNDDEPDEVIEEPDDDITEE